MVFDTLLGWTLNMHPALGIIAVSFIISVIVTFALKFFTDQSLMKSMKEELKELQKEMKTLKNNPKKMAKVNSRFMETNMKYMSMSMKPTLITFFPIILIFGWLNTHIGYYPIYPDKPFEMSILFDQSIDETLEVAVPEGIVLNDLRFFDKHAEATLTGPEGTYEIDFLYKGVTYTKELLITTKREYITPEKSLKKKSFLFSKYDENNALKIVTGNEKIIPFKDLPLPWVNTWGWFGAYILFSIIFSMGLRRIFKIY